MVKKKTKEIKIKKKEGKKKKRKNKTKDKKRKNKKTNRKQNKKDMITYNWNCKTVDVYPLDGENTDVVYNVHWIVTGTSSQLDPDDNAYSATNIGTQQLNVSDITDFIPFEDLTNEIALSWTQAAIGSEGVTSIEDNIANAIADKITPTSITMEITG
tara:strand:+ start:819 stop:1289 length:471 start_codon:yes stop_codon:yes gene_type:complete